MQWEATDQFGNMYIGISAATTFAELVPDLEALVEAVASRTNSPIQITVDQGYSEINGPDPEAVSHVLQVPNFAPQWSPEIEAEVQAIFQRLQLENCAIVVN